MRYAIQQVDPLELERRAYDSLFDLMEDYRDEHPDEDYTAQDLQDQDISVIGRVFWGGGFF